MSDDDGASITSENSEAAFDAALASREPSAEEYSSEAIENLRLAQHGAEENLRLAQHGAEQAAVAAAREHAVNVALGDPAALTAQTHATAQHRLSLPGLPPDVAVLILLHVAVGRADVWLERAIRGLDIGPAPSPPSASSAAAPVDGYVISVKDLRRQVEQLIGAVDPGTPLGPGGQRLMPLWFHLKRDDMNNSLLRRLQFVERLLTRGCTNVRLYFCELQQHVELRDHTQSALRSFPLENNLQISLVAPEVFELSEPLGALSFYNEVGNFVDGDQPIESVFVNRNSRDLHRPERGFFGTTGQNLASYLGSYLERGTSLCTPESGPYFQRRVVIVLPPVLHPSPHPQ